MQEPCVQIAWWRNRRYAHDLTGLATMVTAMRNYMQQHFFARHRTGVAVGELKAQPIVQ
jgi:hypothetical protein